MNLDQEHDFFIQVALDKELRHELKAQQTVDRAFQKDRTVDPSEYAGVQRGVVSMLAGLASQGKIATGTSGASFASGGAGAGKWQIAGIVLIGLITGLLGMVTTQHSEVPARIETNGAVNESSRALLQDSQPTSDVANRMSGIGASGNGVATTGTPDVRPSVTSSVPNSGAANGAGESADRDQNMVSSPTAPGPISDGKQSVASSSNRSDAVDGPTGSDRSSAEAEGSDPATIENVNSNKPDDSVEVGVRLLWSLP